MTSASVYGSRPVGELTDGERLTGGEAVTRGLITIIVVVALVLVLLKAGLIGGIFGLIALVLLVLLLLGRI